MSTKGNFNEPATEAEDISNEQNALVAMDSDEEEDAFYENPLEIIREFGANPLMDRAHKVIVQSLKDVNYRLNLELQDRKDQMKKLVSERETLGVQLYALQQQLARIQMSLETAHNEYNSLIDARLGEEELLKSVNKNNNEQMALYDEYKKQQKKYSTELDSLHETIRQIEMYNDQVKSEIAISRRAAYKVEQNMQELEKAKENQDFYVDDLTKKINALKTQIEFINKQFDTQKQDTTEADAILQETSKELDLISHEKQQLMIQWKAALSGLSRRDEALAQAMITLTNAENAVHDYDVEIDATKREIQHEQAKHESLVNLRDRMENELIWVEENLQKIKAEKQGLEERYNLLTKSLQQTDNESKKLDLALKSIQNDHDIVISNLQTVTQERQKMEEELLLLFSTYSNVNKAVDNLNHNGTKIIHLIHGKENEINEIENSISHYKVNKLNVMNINQSLQENLNQCNQEIKEKEILANKYQLEIRQRNDEIEKKMYRVDRLNKKFEKMVENAGGEENLGPLENTIKNLQKEIETITLENQENERNWLIKQTSLVNLSSEYEDLKEKINEQQARVTILTQQQARLQATLRELKANIKSLKLVNQDYQKDISKLNLLISTNHEQETTLQSSNFQIELNAIEELKNFESECFQLQSSIQEVRNNKATLLNEIVEMERQAMLWEKKIQLDKETKQALDPSVGSAENDSMEKEIHRMDLRYEALKREQERLSIEMERAILKRTTIANRYQKPSSSSLNLSTTSLSGSKTLNATTTNSSNKFKEMTQADIKKQIGNLKKDSRFLAEEISQYAVKYEEKKAMLSSVTSTLEKMTLDYGSAEESCHSLQTNINDLLYQKQLFTERIAYRQKYITRLRDLVNPQNGVLLSVGSDMNQTLQIERKLISSTQALDNVKEIIGELQASYPHLRDVLSRVLEMTDPYLEMEKKSNGNEMQFDDQ